MTSRTAQSSGTMVHEGPTVSRTRGPYLTWGYIAALMVFHAVFAGIRATQASIWYDETATLRAARQSLAQIFSQYAGNGSTLYAAFSYVTVRLLGESEFALRLPALVFGVLTIPMLFLVAVRLAGKRVALTTVTLWTLGFGYVVYHSSNARGYSALLFFGLGCIYYYDRALDHPGRRNLILLTISATLMLMSHLIGGFLLVALGLHLSGFWLASFWNRSDKVDTRHRRLAVWRLILCFVAIGLIQIAISIPMLRDMWQFVDSQTAQPDQPRVYHLRNVLSTIWTYFRDSDYPQRFRHLYLALAGLVLLILRRPRDGFLLLVWIVVPAACFYAANPQGAAVTSPFRYFLILMPGMLLAISNLIARCTGPLANLGVTLLLLSWCTRPYLLILEPEELHVFDPIKTVARALHENVKPSDALVVGTFSRARWSVLNYYDRDETFFRGAHTDRIESPMTVWTLSSSLRDLWWFPMPPDSELVRTIVPQTARNRLELRRLSVQPSALHQYLRSFSFELRRRPILTTRLRPPWLYQVPPDGSMVHVASKKDNAFQCLFTRGPDGQIRLPGRGVQEQHAGSLLLPFDTRAQPGCGLLELWLEGRRLVVRNLDRPQDRRILGNASQDFGAAVVDDSLLIARFRRFDAILTLWSRLGFGAAQWEVALPVDQPPLQILPAAASDATTFAVGLRGDTRTTLRIVEFDGSSKQELVVRHPSGAIRGFLSANGDLDELTYALQFEHSVRVWVWHRHDQQGFALCEEWEEPDLRPIIVASSR